MLYLLIKILLTNTRSSPGPVGAGWCRSVPVGAGWCRCRPTGAGADRPVPVPTDRCLCRAGAAPRSQEQLYKA